MSAQLILRPPRRNEAAALARLGRESFVAKFGHLYRRADLDHFLKQYHGNQAVARQLADPARRVMIAERDGAMIGFCKLGLECGWPEHARGSRVVELKQLYTAPGQTGGGIGSALMDWALAEARSHGADEMQLSVWSGNGGAQKFYRRYGFTKVADIEFWVGAQCDDEYLFAAML